VRRRSHVIDHPQVLAGGTPVTSLVRHVCAVAAIVVGAAAPARAQNLTVSNARIIVGDGQVIERGTIVVRNGRIVSVGTAATSSTPGTPSVDARGMTVIPGFIDGHRHVNTGPDEKEQMQKLLEAGYTTILSGGGPADGNLTLRDHIEKGIINGPRIIPTGSIRLPNTTPDQGRSQIRQIAQMGIKFTGEISVTPRPGPTPQELETLRAILDEAQKVNVFVQVHAVSPQAMKAVVDLGVRKLVHTPHFGWLDFADAQKMAAAGVKQLSTIAFGTPVFGVFANDNTPRFRDGKPWPAAILDGEGRGQEAGYKPVNARTSWDAGIMYGYGTDTTYDPRAGLQQELKTLNLMFSMPDIIKMMGPNTASYLEMSDSLGTLAPGKFADMVILAGNPLDGFWNMLNARVVVKGGKIVVDKR
jgi:imidazolonepropionase-like amidohydrolase